ncbi:MAG: DUF1428 domain-containing protein [Planctomycetes bacterium]|nr:DUF1428 domain-containing protein [Planctomycetota bacterium]
MPYVDGFVVVVPKKKLRAYVALAKKAAKVWREHGALAYHECVGDDLEVHHGLSFPKLVKAKKDDLIVFAWILYRSKKHRAVVNEKALSDPRLLPMLKKPMPFDMKRMSHGGFASLVSL